MTILPAVPRASEPTRLPGPEKAARFVLLDAARLIAAWAVVWIHTPRSPALLSTTAAARFAVPLFTWVAVVFVFQAVRKHPACGFAEYAQSRFRRLYAPFLAWSAIYLLLKLAKRGVLPEQENVFPGPEFLFWGGAYHLWFLPFILIVSLVAFLAAHAVWGMSQSSCRAWASMAGAAGLGFALGSVPQVISSSHENWACIWDAMPAVCWGAAYGMWSLPDGPARGISNQPVLLAAVIFFALEVWLLACGRQRLVENAAGVLLGWISLSTPGPRWLTGIARWGALAYGIYCSHLLFIKLIESVANRFDLLPTPGLDLATFAATVVAATTCSWLLARWAKTRWLVQ